MRKTSPLLLAVLAAACAPDQDGTTMDAAQLTAPLFEVRGDHFRTHATGSEEVPANSSLAQGQAMFQLSDDGTTLSYKLIVANIENVTQSHIHLPAPAGVNAGIVVWLYPSAPPLQLIPGRSQGVLAEGEITSANFMGVLAGESMDVLLGHLRSGNAYVNVHTTQFPPGEIRGQIR
jgi:hypothetical protein